MRLIIIGGGGMAHEAAWYAADCGFKVKGYLADEENPKFKANFLGRWQDYSANLDDSFIIAIGNPHLMDVRKEMFVAMRARGWKFANLIHPTAQISPSAQIGAGNIIAPFCLVTTNVKIGDNNIFNVRTSVMHDDSIDSHNVFSPNCALSGAVEIGEMNFFGSCACIFPGVKIGDKNKIQSGVMVRKSVSEAKFIYPSFENLIKEI